MVSANWTILAVMGSAVCDAVMDTLQFHFNESVFKKLNQNFWDPKFSWRNKWKKSLKSYPGMFPEGGEMYAWDPKKERFWGSSTVFVSLTDAWHLFKLFRNTLFILAIVFFDSYHADGWHLLICFVFFKGLWSLTFEGTFRLLKRKS